jgi:hypothetical protein
MVGPVENVELYSERSQKDISRVRLTSSHIIRR